MKASRELAEKLNRVNKEILQLIQKEEVIHVDETGLRVANRTQWVHTITTTKYTRYKRSIYRGKKGIRSHLADYNGAVVHEHW